MSAAAGTLQMESNLADLPYGLFQQLAKWLSERDNWRRVFNLGGGTQQPCCSTPAADHESNAGAYKLSATEEERFGRMESAGGALLRRLGNHGQTVGAFMTRLNALAKTHGPDMDRPQLMLGRRFCRLIWSRPEQILVRVHGAKQRELLLECKVSSFPSPHFEWLRDEQPVDGASTRYMVIGCDACINRSQLENVYRLAASSGGGEQGDTDAAGACNGTTTMLESLIAADKVALIISNRSYAPHMPNLITPHCDAESLADALQQLQFKTVVLGDLRLAEMRSMIVEYRRLLGDGVYALFYFVGHGVEVHGGACHLLPVGAPGDNYGPEDCLSLEWIMSTLRDVTPALNVILLDICRRSPSHRQRFIDEAEKRKRAADGDATTGGKSDGRLRVNRNTLYGYATSGGVGAYEVKGELNGVFMKYLRKRIGQPQPVQDMLRRVFRDVEKDSRVTDVQVPELHSNLTRARSLSDPIVVDGHTTSYNHHTFHWRSMHELPNPIRVEFSEPGLQLAVTLWFEFVGHFTNKVYVFSSVSDLHSAEHERGGDEETKCPSNRALSYVANLRFPCELETSVPRVCTDCEEGISLCVMVSHLQRLSGDGSMQCRVELWPRSALLESGEFRDNAAALASKEVALGEVLITRLRLTSLVRLTNNDN